MQKHLDPRVSNDCYLGEEGVKLCTSKPLHQNPDPKALNAQFKKRTKLN